MPLILSTVFALVAAASPPPAPVPAQREVVVIAVDDATRLPAGEVARLRRRTMAAAAAPGLVVKDLSELASALFRPGTLAPTFERRPPSKWPAALLPDWEQGHAACRARLPGADADPMRRMQSARIAVQCQQELSAALYARLLRHHQARRVLEVSVSETTGGPRPPTTLTVRSFVVGAAEGRVVKRELPLAELPSAIALAIAELQSGKGAPYPMRLREELPAATP